MNKVQQTEDYSSFTRIKGNRTINKAQVKKLYDSFNEHPELASAVPIIVNDKMEIIDGQHRKEALKKLGLPISYVQIDGLDLRDVQIVNSATKNWSPTDYARSFAELGNDNYKTYLEFREKYHFTHSILMLMLTGAMQRDGGNTTYSFRHGKFKVGNLEQANKISKQFKDVVAYYKRADSRVFAVAFKRAAINPNYNHKRMLEKIQAYGAKFLKDSPYAEDYMRQLEKIYNYHNGQENRVRLF